MVYSQLENFFDIEFLLLQREENHSSHWYGINLSYLLVFCGQEMQHTTEVIYGDTWRLLESTYKMW